MKKLLILSIIVGQYNIINAQNVGIGNLNPTYKLDVSGSINTDSLYRISGSTVLSVKGQGNTLVGIQSGLSYTSGTLNTAIGNLALYSDTSGSFNTATGFGTVYSNIGGHGNAAYGLHALYYNTVGSRNVAIGNRALYNNKIGNSNISIGEQSMHNNNLGSYNVAVGAGALWGNLYGDQNTAIGENALASNTSGNFNIGIGQSPLFLNTTGANNTAVGRFALYNVTTGWDNVSVGNSSLSLTKTAHANVAVGIRAGSRFDNGYYNTFLGGDADANGAGYYNSVAIGNSATVTAPLQVRIGGSFITSIGGYQNWTNISDGRFKKNVTENVKGLDFILKLRPVTYNLDVIALSEKLQEGRTKENNNDLSAFVSAKEKMLLSGFVAQEVEQASKETGYEFSGVDKPKNANDFYGLRYAEFVVPLVKAIQEQQQIIRELQLQIDELRKKIGD